MRTSSALAIASAICLGVGVLPGGVQAHGRLTIHHIDVVVNETGSGFQISAPCKEHKVDDARRGQKVIWHVHNKGRNDLELAVGNFGRHPIETCTSGPDVHKAVHATEKLDPEPLEFKSRTSSVVVKSGSDGFLEATIKPRTIKPRTYKYDILVNKKAVLDPEIEIEK